MSTPYKNSFFTHKYLVTCCSRKYVYRNVLLVYYLNMYFTYTPDGVLL